MFLRWDFEASGFLWLDVCVRCVHVMVLLWICMFVLCNACEQELCVKMVACVLCVL